MGPAASLTEHDHLSAVEERAWRGLVRAHSCLVKRLDAELEAEHGLPLSSFQVLLRLARADGGKLRMHDVAASVLLSRSGLTRLVDRLEKEGLVDRCSCENDARGAYAVITAAGRERVAAAKASHHALVREMLTARCTDEELGQLGDLLDRLLPPEACCD
jgi:DNA-binding MarR family transcriptional regulator